MITSVEPDTNSIPVRGNPRDYHAVPARYEGHPVLYNPLTDDLAYESVQDAQIVAIPDHAEAAIRRQTELSGRRADLDRYTDEGLVAVGNFVKLINNVNGYQHRRGEVLHSDSEGVTLLVTAFGNTDLARTEIEFWRWQNIVLISASRPNPRERTLLQAAP